MLPSDARRGTCESDVTGFSAAKNVNGVAALSAGVCKKTPLRWEWASLQQALLTALIACCAKSMRWLVSLHGSLLGRVDKRPRTHFEQFVLLLLRFPCFKLICLLFKLAYALQERRALLLYREVTELSGERKLDVLLAVLAGLVFGYIWAANARMDVVWDQGYEAGIRQLSEACEEE